MNEESMPGLEASLELVNLGRAVEDAYQLAFKIRMAWNLHRPKAITREEQGLLYEACKQIAAILGVTTREVWIDYCESTYCYDCGHGCACKGDRT
jgi:hypothetical protein